MKNKKVIYSAMIGGYDDIENIAVSQVWDCFMFTDLSEEERPKNSGWIFVNIDKSKGKDSGFVNRWYKMHPHILFPEYDESIYIDGNIKILDFSFINSRVKELQYNDICISMPKHFARDCIYKEAEVIASYRLDSKSNINKTVKFLKKRNYPINNGLYENNLIYRKHNNERIIKLMQQWWWFINEYSKRDQMSLCFLLWNNKIKSDAFFYNDLSVRNHEDFKFTIEHKGRTKINYNKKYYTIKIIK